MARLRKAPEHSEEGEARGARSGLALFLAGLLLDIEVSFSEHL